MSIFNQATSVWKWLPGFHFLVVVSSTSLFDIHSSLLSVSGVLHCTVKCLLCECIFFFDWFDRVLDALYCCRLQKPCCQPSMTYWPSLPTPRWYGSDLALPRPRQRPWITSDLWLRMTRVTVKMRQRSVRLCLIVYFELLLTLLWNRKLIELQCRGYLLSLSPCAEPCGCWLVHFGGRWCCHC